MKLGRGPAPPLPPPAGELAPVGQARLEEALAHVPFHAVGADTDGAADLGVRPSLEEGIEDRALARVRRPRPWLPAISLAWFHEFHYHRARGRVTTSCDLGAVGP